MQLVNILIRRGWVTQAELDDVRSSDTSDPHNLVGRLVQLGSLSREQALRALSECFDAEAVDLSEIEIKPEVLRLVPGTLAWKREIIPISQDSESGAVTIACLDPHNDAIRQDLMKVLGSRDLKLVVTLKSSLQASLLQYYRNTPSEHPDDPVDRAESPGMSESIALIHSRLLLVAPINETSTRLARALACEFDQVVMVDTPEEAEAEVDKERYDLLLINDVIPGPYLRLLRRFRSGSIEGTVNFFTNLQNLVLADTGPLINAPASGDPMGLVTSLTAGAAPQEAEPDSALTMLVDRLCRRLCLPSTQRARAILAARIIDLERTANQDKEPSEPKVRLLDGSNPALSALADALKVKDVLQQVHQNSTVPLSSSMSFSRLVSTIVSQVQYCSSKWDCLNELTPDSFETIKANLTALAGRRYPSEVVAAFIEVLRENVEQPQSGRDNSRVVVLDESGEAGSRLAAPLEKLAFQVKTVSTADTFLQEFRRRRPDLLLIVRRGASAEVQNLIEDLTAGGVAFDEVPTFVLVEPEAIPGLTRLLKAGIEEILPLDGDIDPLFVKMCRTRSRLEQVANQRLLLIRDVGTHGTLEDMNVVDLLQAMGLGDKTVRLSITAHGNHLTIYLDQGRLTFAECGDLTGAAAVQAGLTWTKGVWSVDPVEREHLPEPNNDRSIDSILIEGCCIIDENAHISDSGSIEIEPLFIDPSN